MAKITISDREIEERYRKGSFNLTQERNDFLLPQILDFVEQRRWLNLHPEYQRRMVWDNARKSLFIESLLMNIPIPPIFLFEWDYSRYEVMDGQQRLNSIISFYNNEFKLTGLERWKELNGKTFSECPPVIKRGLDRRRISATIITTESRFNESDEEQQTMHQLVFERLNTGGMKLNAQELRNCLFSGPFNDLIIQLAGTPLFNDTWGIPRYIDNIIDGQISTMLSDNSYFKRMVDCEIILRFFAFRIKSYVKGSINKILDDCMKRNRNINQDEVAILNSVFITRLENSYKILGNNAFKIKDSRNKLKVSIPLFDAIMVAVDHNYKDITKLINNKDKIQSKFKKSIEDPEFYELITGKVGTAPSIIKRSEAISDIFKESIK